MSNDKKQIDKEKTYFGIRRGEMAFLVAIVIGLVLGTLIKKVRVGLMLVLIIGLGIVFLNSFRKKTKN
jgi:F0F1-type ATP synthase assembly protein I